MKIIKWWHLILLTIIVYIIYIIYLFINIKTSELIDDNYYEEDVNYNTIIKKKLRSKKIIQKIQIKHINNKLILITPKNFIYQKIYFFIKILRYSDKKLDHLYCIVKNKKNINIITDKKIHCGLYRVIISWNIKNKSFIYDKNIII